MAQQNVLVPIEKSIGKNTIIYRMLQSDGMYGLSVSAADGGAVYLEDVTRTEETAEMLLSLFADNLVYPFNAAEILDDLLGTVLL